MSVGSLLPVMTLYKVECKTRDFIPKKNKAVYIAKLYCSNCLVLAIRTVIYVSSKALNDVYKCLQLMNAYDDTKFPENNDFIT